MKTQINDITPTRTPTQKKFFKERTPEVRHHAKEFEIHCNASNLIYLVMPR